MAQALPSRLRSELLDAEIDLPSSSIHSDESALRVTAKLSLPRLLVGLLFALPGIILAVEAMTIQGPIRPLLVPFALMVCPFLAFVSLLLGFAIAEKSVSFSSRTATKSLRVFTWQTGDTVACPKDGTVKLSAEWDVGEYQHIGYRVRLSSIGGFVFSENSYSEALTFAEKLAAGLDYPLEDSVEAQYRR